MLEARLRIDTHHHIVPPDYRAWIEAKGVMPGGLPMPEWSVETDLRTMADHGIAVGMLSVSTPGVWFGDKAEARHWARRVNTYAAEVVGAHPGKFGFLATLTLPDLDGALEELAYAFDDLKADGVVLPSSVDGIYLGDPAFDPLMAELDRRGAVVFEHPSAGVPAAAGVPSFAVDFLVDTVRAAISLCRSGCMDRYPNLKVILSHGGGFLPFVADRIAPVCVPGDGNVGDLSRGKEGLRRLKRFYFDTALAAGPSALPSLLDFAEPDHVTFGSDTPYAPKAFSLHFTRMLDGSAMGGDGRRSINRGAAERLFPRLAPSF